MGIKRKGVSIGGSDSDIEYDNLPLGEIEGRLVYVADLGLQSNDKYMGELKINQQLVLGIEIMGQHITVDGVEKPRLLWSKAFNVFRNLTENGNELKLMKLFDSTATFGGVADWEAQIGKPVNAVIEHKEGKGKNAGKLYDNIASLVALPKKYQDGVAKGDLTDGCVGGEEEADSPAIKALYGLSKYNFDKRLGEKQAQDMMDKYLAEKSNESSPKPPKRDLQVDKDNLPF